MYVNRYTQAHKYINISMHTCKCSLPLLWLQATFKAGPILVSAWTLKSCSCLHTELVRSLFCMFSFKHKQHKKRGRLCLLGVFQRRIKNVDKPQFFFSPHLMLVSVNKFCHYWDISSTKLLFRKKIKIETSMTFFLSARKQMMVNKWD